ncbi:unnamed protein product, partial [Brassica rapa subsp. trilocularis]
LSLLSLTEYVTRTFVPGEQLRVNIERDRRLEEGTAAQVLVRCRIISPKSLFPPEKVIAFHPRFGFKLEFQFFDPCCFCISAGGEVGAAQLLRGGKEHMMSS